MRLLENLENQNPLATQPPQKNMPSITLCNLSVGYQQARRTPTIVLAGLNATLRSGRLTCLVGANGIGKSTLLRTLAAFQPPLAGQMLYLADAKPTPLDIATLSQAQLAQLVSVVLTAKPSVGLGRSPYTNIWGTLRAEDHRMVEWAMDVVGITNLRQRMVQTLSDGERQKMMIAKALAQDTPVMLLDEPTAFLDYKSKVEMLALLSRLAHETNKIVLLSTHDLEQAVHTADALWVVTKAQQATNTPQENPSNTSPQHLATQLRVLEKHIRTDEQGLQQIVFEPENKAENTASQGLKLTATADFDQRTHALLRLLSEGK